MKGTMPRGLTSAADLMEAERLHTSAKDRSENVMIVDLVRNDLGRIARVGNRQQRNINRQKGSGFIEPRHKGRSLGSGVRIV